MSGLIDFVGGAGAAGAQMGLEAFRSTIEEERQARLMEMQQRFQMSRDQQQQTWASGERKAGQEFQAGEAAKGRDFTSGENQKGRDFTAAEAQRGRDFTSSESQKGRDFTAGENDKSRKLEQQRIGISAANLQLAREQAQMGKQIIGEDGRVAFVGSDGKGGVKITGYLKTEDGKDFVAPKNISESAKMEFTSISERIKALDKVAAESLDDKAKETARAEIMKLTDRQAQILNGGKAPAGPAIKDPFAPKTAPAADRAGPLIGASQAPDNTPTTKLKPGSKEAAENDRAIAEARAKRKAAAKDDDEEDRPRRRTSQAEIDAFNAVMAPRRN